MSAKRKKKDNTDEVSLRKLSLDPTKRNVQEIRNL